MFEECPSTELQKLSKTRNILLKSAGRNLASCLPEYYTCNATFGVKYTPNLRFLHGLLVDGQGWFRPVY
jgi:hypothetical protein